MPASPQDLAQLPAIALTVVAQPTFFTLENAAGVTHEVRLQNIVFSTNTAYASRAAALAGDGLLRATTFSVQDDVAAGRLVRVLPSGRCPRAISTRSTLPPRTCRRKCASSSTR
jgi:DNA-binding transcriptional LysR family regulator